MPYRMITLAILALAAMLTIVACDDEAEAEAGAPGAYTVSADVAAGMIEAGDRIVIDVRRPDEFEQLGRVVGALNISVEAPDFADRIAELDPDQPYLVYCRTGRRSEIAAAQMATAGFADIADAGGLADLARAGVPIE